MNSRIQSAGLADVDDKLHSGERLSLADGVRLFECPDLLAVGSLANREREKRHGARTYFNYNLRLEPTNVCVASCLFCSFARLKPTDGADRRSRLHDVARTGVGLVIALGAILNPAILAQDLEDARRQLADRLEAQVKKGAEACARANNVEAVEALLEVLNRTESRQGYLAPAHYRDVAWDAVLQITDPAGQKRVLSELRSNRGNSYVRQWCAELLGIYGSKLPGGQGSELFGAALTSALRDSFPGVRQWAARSLGMLRHADAESKLLKLVKGKRPYLRANVIEALARIDKEKHRDRLETATRKDKNAGVRCALLRAAFEIYADQCEAVSAERFCKLPDQ